jgi:hypothetical protein
VAERKAFLSLGKLCHRAAMLPEATIFDDEIEDVAVAPLVVPREFVRKVDNLMKRCLMPFVGGQESCLKCWMLGMMITQLFAIGGRRSRSRQWEP